MSIPEERFIISYEEYLTKEEDVRLEVINGIVYDMSPAPSTRHQIVQRELLTEFNIYLRGKDCSVFGSPLDVCLSDEDDIEKIKEWVEPDIFIVCDKNKIKDKRIVGAPDLIIEILSSSTAKLDRVVKYNRYMEAKVREYWIVDPLNEFIDVYVLDGNKYQHKGVFSKEDTIKVSILESLIIDLRNIFVWDGWRTAE
ncbi:Uma2 family endonuclease [Bacillaceae bacterium Marseille-Q3522]|nr:Uma2 family endonuclease [Bacillaceae bacterium Marseille-Q3522]